MNSKVKSNNLFVSTYYYNNENVCVRVPWNNVLRQQEFESQIDTKGMNQKTQLELQEERENL